MVIKLERSRPLAPFGLQLNAGMAQHRRHWRILCGCVLPVIRSGMCLVRAAASIVICDTVNTASRIEGMTKELDVPILLSDSVVAHCLARFV
jgi:class 3 adenylate cyclase